MIVGKNLPHLTSSLRKFLIISLFSFLTNSDPNHGPLRTVCLQLFDMWPSFGYFSNVEKEIFGCPNSTTSANFRNFFVHGISYIPTG